MAISWPAFDDWERARPLIKRLYITEDRNLNELIEIMSSVHGFHGTVKMYKSRLRKWGFEKYNKKGDMLWLLYKKNQRDAAGKSSSFVVRGRAVCPEEIQRYFKRKKGLPELPDPDPPTPPHVSYRTPSPVTVPPMEDTNISELVSTKFRHDSSYSLSKHNGAGALHETVQEMDIIHSSIRGANDVENCVLDDLPMEESDQLVLLSHQQHFQYIEQPLFFVAEHLSFSVHAYLSTELQAGRWVTDEGGTLRNPQVSAAIPDVLNVFRGHCYTAMKFIQKGSYVEARRLLSSACNLAKDILQEENPHTLEFLLDVYLSLITRGYQDILNLIRRYLSDMALQLEISQHPWGEVIVRLGAMPFDQLKDAIAQAWQCTYSTFKTHLGQFHESAVKSYLNLIGRVVMGGIEEERLLRQLLSDCEQLFGPHDCRVLGIMLRLGNSLSVQHRDVMAETVATELFARAQAVGSWINQIRALELSADAQYYQGKKVSACESLWTATEMIGERSGESHPSRIWNLIRLESWLRESGNTEDADIVHHEIDHLIGSDDSD